jgi:hypothetical protein
VKKKKYTGVQVLRADSGAVHNRTTTEQLHTIIDKLETFFSGRITYESAKEGEIE